MGLLKDIYDILGAQPQLKGILDKALMSFLRSWTPKDPLTRQQRKDYLQALVVQLTDDSFALKFKSELDYFGALLATVVETTRVAERGCIIETLYQSDCFFYFPVNLEDLELRKDMSRATSSPERTLRNGRGDLYVFYAIRTAPGTPSCDAATLHNSLNAIAKSNPKQGEKAALLSVLSSSGCEVIELVGFEQDKQTGSYSLRRRDLFSGDGLPLDFATPQTRPRIAKALKSTLTFTRL